MKQISLIIAFLMMITTPGNSGAQSTNVILLEQFDSTDSLTAKLPYKKKSKTKVASVNTNALNNFVRSNTIISETKVTNVNIKAVRHFIRTYKSIPNVKWFKTGAGFLAHYSSKGIDTKIVYDEKGGWFYNLFSYTEASLAFEIRDMVKRKYYDNDILAVYQFDFNNKASVYIIRMQDQQSKIIALKVCDGEIVDITDCQ
jgi:hypothetical protein